MSKVKVAISGFGRIGRLVLRAQISKLLCPLKKLYPSFISSQKIEHSKMLERILPSGTVAVRVTVSPDL